MHKLDRATLCAQYEQALHRLAAALELEYAEVKGMFGDIGAAKDRAAKIVGFFRNPQINETLQDVILISQEFQALPGETNK
ncbi:MAG: hypothetical protein ACM3WU_00270 [Bacillota bacterium]